MLTILLKSNLDLVSKKLYLLTYCFINHKTSAFFKAMKLWIFPSGAGSRMSEKPRMLFISEMLLLPFTSQLQGLSQGYPGLRFSGIPR